MLVMLWIMPFTVKKCKGVGVVEVCECWFRSYLTDSVQKSPTHGPLLFLLYINDMSAAIKGKLLCRRTIQSCLRTDLVGIEATLSSELEFVTSYCSIRVKHNPLCFERREHLKNDTLLILYVMETSLIQSQSLSCDVIASDVLFETSKQTYVFVSERQKV